MAAFGYGSAYSFNNMGQNDMLGGTSFSSNPRSIVPASQSKGAMQTASSSTGISPQYGSQAGVYGVNYDPTVTKDPGFNPTFDANLNVNNQGSMPTFNLAYGGSGLTNNSWSSANGWQDLSNPGVLDWSGYNYGAGDVGNFYNQAFQQLAWDRQSSPAVDGFYDSKYANLVKNYEAWVNQMMNSGAYGMGGSTSYGGGY